MIFGPTKDTIDSSEFRRAIGNLSNFNQKSRGYVELMFLGDLTEESNYERGIDKFEFKQKIDWLKSNMSKHYLSASQIEEIEEEFGKFFNER